MALKDTLKKIDELKKQIDKLLPMDKKNQAELDKKFKLEWNYNSNHIEGNTLTYGETQMLLMFGKVTGNHSLRDIEEMKAHEAARKKVEEYAYDADRPISESDIRELNKVILVEPFRKESVTEEGIETSVEVIPGEYKKYSNHVKLSSGDLLTFAEPEEVPQKMHDLIEWYRKDEQRKEIHPLIIAATFHYKLVRIHPFADGNGRVSRLVMNYHLIKNGFPPVIIKSADKENYLTALNKADSGMPDAFNEYIAEQLLWSLKIKLKAAKGESLEEEDDIEKEITLWKKEKSILPEYKPRSAETIINIYEKSVIHTFRRFINKVDSLFNDVFTEVNYTIAVNAEPIGTRLAHIASKVVIENTNFDKLSWLTKKIFNTEIKPINIYSISLIISFIDYKWRENKPFNHKKEFGFDFYGKHSYYIVDNEGNPYKTTPTLYSEQFTIDEQKRLVRILLEELFEEIKEKEKAE